MSQDRRSYKLTFKAWNENVKEIRTDKLQKKNTEKSQNGFVQKDQKLNRASKQEICKKYRTKISAIKAHSSQDYVFLNLEVLFQLSKFPFTTPVSPKKKKVKIYYFSERLFCIKPF